MVAAAKASGPWGVDFPEGPETTQGAIRSLPRGRRHPFWQLHLLGGPLSYAAARIFMRCHNT